jgi:hypothetical protein
MKCVVVKMELLIEKKLKEWIKECLLLKSSNNREESWLLKVLPFEKDGIRCESSCCQGLTYNRGLLTQCLNKKKSDEKYCRGCCVSLIGTVDERKEAGLYTYIDRKGHKVQQYLDVLKKLKIRVEDVVAEASRLGIKISSEHLEEKVVHRGRPKKEIVKKEIKKDLFARLYLEEYEVEDVKAVDVLSVDVLNVDVLNVDVLKKRKKLSALEKKAMNDIYELKIGKI